MLAGLFYKLAEFGVKGKAWRILKQLYTDFLCKVRVGNIMSGEFYVTQGIHQGDPCSMFLYCVLINDLLKELQSIKPSIRVNKTTFNALCFADDISLLATCEHDIQNLLNIAIAYIKKWHFEFNHKKCCVITFGNVGLNRNLKMGGHVINVVETDNHLGTVLSFKSKDVLNHFKNKVTKATVACCAIRSLGSRHVPLTTAIASKLYWNLCVSKVCYGVAITNVDEATVDILEEFHYRAAKSYLNLPVSTM